MENTKKTNNTEEVDLAQFFRWVGRGFNRLGNSLLYGLATLRNLFFDNLYFFAGIIAAGLLVGYLYSRWIQEKLYPASFVVNCNFTNQKLLENNIRKLNMLCGESGQKTLSTVMKIPLTVAQNISHFEIKTFVTEDDIIEMELLQEQLKGLGLDKKEIVDKVLPQISLQNRNTFQITLFLKNPTKIDSLDGALINYFEGLDFIRRRIEITRSNLLKRRDKLVSESQKLDSLKKVVLATLKAVSKSPRGSNNVILNEEDLADPLQISKEDLRIHEELMLVDRQLYLQPDFEIVDRLTTFAKPESADLTAILLRSLLISFVAGYLILGIIRFDRMLATYPRRR
jgi:hypothetical protein